MKLYLNFLLNVCCILIIFFFMTNKTCIMGKRVAYHQAVSDSLTYNCCSVIQSFNRKDLKCNATASLTLRLCNWITSFVDEGRVRDVSDDCITRFMSVNAVPQKLANGEISCIPCDCTRWNRKGAFRFCDWARQGFGPHTWLEIQNYCWVQLHGNTGLRVYYKIVRASSCSFSNGHNSEASKQYLLARFDDLLQLTPGSHIGTVIKIVSRKVRLLNKVRSFFAPGQSCLLYKTRIRSWVEYCLRLWDGSDKYLLVVLHRLRWGGIIGDEKV